MKTVKTYKGHDVPEDAQRYHDGDGIQREGFWKEDENGYSHFYGLGDHATDHKWVITLSTMVGEKLPEEKPYTPEVGDMCKITAKTGNPREAFFVGVDENDKPVFSLGLEVYWALDDTWEITKAKTECEVVVEWAESQRYDKDDDLLGLLTRLYDLGALKLPEDKQ